MQSDTPQGDPRLQRTNPGPVVAVRIIDPCIVFLEATLPGEIPLLAACWARSCREWRSAEGHTCLALGHVVVVQNQTSKGIERRNLWKFGRRNEKAVFLISGGKNGAFVKCDFKATTFKTAPDPVFQWHIRFLSGKEHDALERTVRKFSRDPNEVAGVILRRANVDWPSITDAMSALRRYEKNQRRRKSSLVRRIISSVFRKKPKLVAA
jgi:hypothetical protein